MRVLLLENIDIQAERYFLDNSCDIDSYQTSLNDNQLKSIINRYHIIGISNKTHLNSNILQYANNLKIIACFCFKTDNIDLDCCTQNGICVFNSSYQKYNLNHTAIINDQSIIPKVNEDSKNIAINICQKIDDYLNRGITLGSINFPNIVVENNNNYKIFNLHHNKYSTLSKISNIICKHKYNISSCVLSTNNDVGLCIFFLDNKNFLVKDIEFVKDEIQKLNESINTQIIQPN